MKQQKKIAVLGGDLRQYIAARELSLSGASVELWGLERSAREEEIPVARSLVSALEGADAVLLPLPATTDGVLLFSPLAISEKRIRLCDILSEMPSGSLLIGGRIPETVVASAEASGIRVRDYFDSEEFQIQNAYTTAEAAISIAMNSLTRNLRGARVAVTGFGRIAKHLVRLLLSLSARVTVAARKSEDLAWAESLGCDTLFLREGVVPSELAHGYDVIYNTVPHWLFGREFLSMTTRDTFLIDLASVPGGVDVLAAKELGSNVLWATSLPGKYAPTSAGQLIAACVGKILREEVSGE
ncbi:MAG: dipicolinate synthase [Clostridia bacterium]|nr:dipicolinate synthase [Clostridia bacterium]